MASLQFKGKAYVQNYHLTVKHHELVPCKAKSLTKEVSLHDNLIVHGDNLKALKALLPTYAGKVKCIYIDPPYNTGNEHWCYNDAVNSPMHQEWFEKEVDREDLTRHDKWLCMMLPRLKLLREFLRDDGVIFISIDDNEVHHLRMLMDEVFGEANFVACFVRRRRMATGMRDEPVSPDHEYVLCSARRKEDSLLFGWQKEASDYPFEDQKGRYRSTDLTVGMSREQRPNQFFPISKKGFQKEYLPPPDRVWRFHRPTMAKHIENDNIIWPEDCPEKKLSRPRFKTRYDPRKTNPVSTWIDSKQENDGVPSEDAQLIIAGLNQEATKELRELFDEQVLAYPKPVSLVKGLIQAASVEDDIILDSFAGSGTTAHAVMDLNAEDGGNRRFILVECEEYADKITAERVRRVIQGVPGAKDEALKKGLGGSFSFFELGKPVEVARLFKPKELPAYKELAKYVFFTATGAEFDAKKVDEKSWFIGETGEAEYYLFYKPDIEYLKRGAALTLDRAKTLGKPGKKRRVVFAPSKYVDEETLERLKIGYAQLPFEIYRLAE